MSEYSAPPWAGTPAEEFSLECLKGGAIVERLELSRRSHYILGRHGEQAHHVLMHPTVSRLHAVLQFAANADGDAYDREPFGIADGSPVSRADVASDAISDLDAIYGGTFRCPFVCSFAGALAGAFSGAQLESQLCSDVDAVDVRAVGRPVSNADAVPLDRRAFR